MKEKEQYQLYEKARKRTKQKKRLYFHFILFLVGSVFLIVLNKIIKFKPEYDWFVWVIFFWLFFLIVHFVNVFFMNRFFGKEWIQIQTENLINKHKKELEKLEKTLDNKGVFDSNNSEEEINS